MLLGHRAEKAIRVLLAHKAIPGRDLQVLKDLRVRKVKEILVLRGLRVGMATPGLLDLKGIQVLVLPELQGLKVIQESPDRRE